MRAEWSKLKAADLACGSGMLLNAWIEAVKERMRADGAHEGQCSTWHRMAVEELASGLDINPVSLQLAAGRFTLGNLEIDYRKIGLYALEHGKTPSGAVRLGTLELLGDGEIVGAAPDRSRLGGRPHRASGREGVAEGNALRDHEPAVQRQHETQPQSRARASRRGCRSASWRCATASRRATPTQAR